jgi:hypothetical protein
MQLGSLNTVITIPRTPILTTPVTISIKRNPLIGMAREGRLLDVSGINALAPFLEFGDDFAVVVACSGAGGSAQSEDAPVYRLAGLLGV